MKFDFESLSTEPLFYMLMHSGAFVTVLGIIFFILGMMFGYATWGRYKRQTRELRGENIAMKDEIAQLKRKIGDHSIKSGPTIAMATETIHMPSKESVSAAAVVSGITAEAITTRDIRPPTTGIAMKNRLPKSRANVIKPRATPAPPSESVAKDEVKTSAPPPAEPATASTTLSPTAPPPPPARHSSPLAAIIAPAAVTVSQEPELKVATPAPADVVPAENIPTPAELPVEPLPAVTIQPKPDSKFGLIYPARPEKIDDLTAIKGIAQVLEQRLHELGIYTYSQIAGWNDENIKEFSSRLAFKDRIQRERWVEQAQQLLAKKAA